MDMLYNSKFQLKFPADTRKGTYGFSTELAYKNSSLEYHCIRAKNSLSTYINLNHSLELAQEVQDCLCKINKQIDLSTSEINKTQNNLLLLFEHDLYYLLAKLGILKITRELFDEQMLLFKRLVNNLLIEQDANSTLPLVKAMRNTNTADKISQCLGIYLVEYTNYDEVNIFHLNFIVSFVPKILEVYKKFPGLLEKWLQHLCQNVTVIEALAGQDALPRGYGLDNRKHFPLYDLLYSLLFTEDCQDQIIEAHFLELIEILNNNERPFLFQWLQQFSDISRCFIDRFAYIFNEACIKEGENKISEYQRFLKAFNKVLVCLSSEFQEQCIKDFEAQFFSKILQLHDVNNPHTIYTFLIKTIECMLPYLPKRIFKDFIIQLFQDELFTQIVDVCFSQTRYLGFRIMFLKLFNEILRTKCYPVIRDLFCFKDGVIYKNIYRRPNESLRVKAMQISKLKHGDTSPTDKGFFFILQKFQIKSIQNEYLLYDNGKLIPRVISENLLTYFQNNHECNRILASLVINLLCFERGIICNICSIDTGSEYCDIEHIIEFLFEAFFNYHDMIDELNERKYHTMNSKTCLQTYQYEYLRPTKKFLDKLSSLEYKTDNSNVDHGLLRANMNSFQDLFNEIFYCVKFRQIIHCNVKS